MAYTTESFQKETLKPWGRELLLTSPFLSQTGKILEVRAGMRLSLQYHETKEETLCLYSGQATLELENSRGELEKLDMEPLKGYYIAPKQKHRLCAITDCAVFEVSSPETGTTVRVEDDFGRPDETEAMRAGESRGQNA